MEPLRSLSIILLSAASLLASNPDYSQSFRWTNRPGESTDGQFVISGAGRAKTFDNVTSGCLGWKLTYAAEGFSALSINLQTSTRVNYFTNSYGPSGTWSTFGGTSTTGSLPITSVAQGTYVGYGNYPYIAVNVSSVTGTGSIDATLACWTSINYALAAGGGGGGGGATVCTTSAGAIQFNTSGALDCTTDLLGGSSVSGGRLAVNYSAADSEQARTIFITPSYTGSAGVGTLAGVYNITTFTASAGTSTHVLSYVDNSVDSSTGSGSAPGLMASYFAAIRKTGSSTGGTYASFFPGFLISAGTASAYSAMDIGAPTISGGTVNNLYGIVIRQSWNSATADNCGICIGGTGTPAGVWSPLVVFSGTSLFGGPISMVGQGNSGTSGTQSLLNFGTNYQGAATTGEFALITGTVSGFNPNGTIVQLSAIDMLAGSDLSGGSASVTRLYASRMGTFNNNGANIGTIVTYFASPWGSNSGHVTGNTYAFRADDLIDSSGATYDGNSYGVYIGKVKPTTATLSGTAYSAYFSDTAGTVYVAGPLVSFQQKSTTGQRYVCIDTTGKLVSSVAACVGT